MPQAATQKDILSLLNDTTENGLSGIERSYGILTQNPTHPGLRLSSCSRRRLSVSRDALSSTSAGSFRGFNLRQTPFAATDTEGHLIAGGRAWYPFMVPSLFIASDPAGGGFPGCHMPKASTGVSCMHSVSRRAHAATTSGDATGGRYSKYWNYFSRSWHLLPHCL